MGLSICRRFYHLFQFRLQTSGIHVATALLLLLFHGPFPYSVYKHGGTSPAQYEIYEAGRSTFTPRSRPCLFRIRLSDEGSSSSTRVPLFIPLSSFAGTSSRRDPLFSLFLPISFVPRDESVVGRHNRFSTGTRPIFCYQGLYRHSRTSSILFKSPSYSPRCPFNDGNQIFFKEVAFIRVRIHSRPLSLVVGVQWQ